MKGRSAEEILRVLENRGDPTPLTPEEKKRVTNRLLRAQGEGFVTRQEGQVLAMRLGLDAESGNKPDTDMWPASANASA